jgi:hypothetical protein
MGRSHVVAEGDHLIGLLGKYKFTNPSTLLDCPENSALASRAHPHILEPGDVVAIPEQKEREYQVATDKVHPFTVKPLLPKLRVVLEDWKHQPLSPRAVEARVDTAAPKVVDVAGDGSVEIEVLPNTREVTLDIYFEDDTDTPSLQWVCRVGRLRREETEAGQLLRLANLGYYRKNVPPDREPYERRAAVEQFQLEQGLTVTGTLDEATASKLVEIHGC